MSLRVHRGHPLRASAPLHHFFLPSVFNHCLSPHPRRNTKTHHLHSTVNCSTNLSDVVRDAFFLVNVCAPDNCKQTKHRYKTILVTVLAPYTHAHIVLPAHSRLCLASIVIMFRVSCFGLVQTFRLRTAALSAFERSELGNAERHRVRTTHSVCLECKFSKLHYVFFVTSWAIYVTSPQPCI